MADPVADEIYERRMELGWSLSELARRAGVAKSTVSMAERGLRSPALAQVRALLDALDLDLVVVAKEQR